MLVRMLQVDQGGEELANERVKQTLRERLGFHGNMLRQDGYVLSRDHSDERCEQELQEQRVLVKMREQELVRAQNDVEIKIEVARKKNDLSVIDELYQISVQHSV